MMTKAMRRWSEGSALAGALLWLLLLLVPVSDPLTEFIARLLLIGVLVVIPLGLSLVGDDEMETRLNLLFTIAVYAQPLAALLVVISFLLQQGLAAALLVCGWLAVTGLLALYGIARLFLNKRMRVEEFSVNAGLVYSVVGGGWLVFSRYGLQPLGFGDTIVLLTAVHFHFAGFAAPLLAGIAGRRLQQSKAADKRALQLAVILIITGTPLVAAGITFSPALAFVGAVVVSLGLLLLALIVSFRIVPRIKRRAAQALLIISSVSSVFAMTLASLYAYSIVTKTLILNIPQMARLHGVANAVGFSLCGLIAWKLSTGRGRADS